MAGACFSSTVCNDLVFHLLLELKHYMHVLQMSLLANRFWHEVRQASRRKRLLRDGSSWPSENANRFPKPDKLSSSASAERGLFQNVSRSRF